MLGLVGLYETRGIREKWTEQQLTQKFVVFALIVSVNKASGRCRCLHFL
jgi:hypothetical protein